MKVKQRPRVLARKPANPGRRDPTRTTMLRRGFGRELAKRYRRLRLAVWTLLVEEDALGLGGGLATNDRFRYDQSPRKVERFRAWLRQQMDSTLAGDRLIEDYIARGYQRGLGRGFDDAKRGGLVARPRGRPLDVSPLEAAAHGVGGEPPGQPTGRDAFLRQQAYRPATINTVKLLAGRTFSELDGVNARMAAAMSRTLADGLVRGLTAEQIAEQMAKEIGLGIERATTIAHSELVRAHSEAQLDALEELGVDEVEAAVEWETREGACPACKPLQGVVFKVSEARGLIPRHPRCKCSWSPTRPGRARNLDLPKNQKRRQKALGQSARAETGERSNTAAREASTWQGADVTNSAALLEFSRLLAGITGNAGGGFFHECDRDKLGHCLPGSGGGAEPAPQPTAKAKDPGERPRRSAGGWKDTRAIADHGKAMAEAHAADPHVQGLHEAKTAWEKHVADLQEGFKTVPIAEFDAQAARLAEAQDMVKRATAALQHESRRSFLRSFSLPSGVKPVSVYASVTRQNSPQARAWDKGYNLFLRDVAAHETLGDTSISVKAERSRPFYQYGTIHLVKTDGPEIALHEFGHHVEHNYPWAKERVAEFRKARFDDSKNVPMRDAAPNHGYKADEVGNPDDMRKLFGEDNAAHYTGKTYPNGETEILSMGLEQLYRDPVHFAATDPTYFALVVGILQHRGEK